jgi:pimeloyl-ACP methyl ester carboxylesterase
VKPRILQSDRVGAGDPPFVLLPGGLTGWQSWMPLVPALSDSRSVVRLQPIRNAEALAGRPGHPTYTADTERLSIAMTLDELEVDEMHLVGWSNGARMALDFALALPRRVRSLTLVEPGAPWLVADVDESARRFHEYFVDLGGRDVTDRDLCAFLVQAGLGEEGTDFKALPQWELWSAGRQALSWGGEQVISSSAAGIEGYQRLAIPTLVVRGRSTSPWLSKVAALLATEMPMATLVEIDGGHACVLESPEQFLAALTGHVKAVS